MAKSYLIGNKDSKVKYRVGIIEIDGISVIEIITLLREGKVSRTYLPYKKEFVDRLNEALLGLFDE